MLLNTTLFQTSTLSLTSRTKISFNNEIEFSVFVRDYDELNYSLHIEDVKGCYKTLEVAYSGQREAIPYNQGKDCYLTPKKNFEETAFTFYIMLDIEYTIVKYSEVPREVVKCQIKIPSRHLKFLKVGEYYLHFVTIKGFENVKLKCFIKKPKVNFIDLTIEKSAEIKINGTDEDYTVLEYDSRDIDNTITLEFDPNALKELNEKIGESKDENDNGCITHIAYPTSQDDSFSSKNNENKKEENSITLSNKEKSSFTIKFINCFKCLSKRNNDKEEVYQRQFSDVSDKNDDSRFAYVKYFANNQN
uniref:Uncharacterized protein n=1 Tax=Panagrolaimus davidi TaxID=227884 RepID=A0A914QBY4_9BILA